MKTQPTTSPTKLILTWSLTSQTHTQNRPLFTPYYSLLPPLDLQNQTTPLLCHASSSFSPYLVSPTHTNLQDHLMLLIILTKPTTTAHTYFPPNPNLNGGDCLKQSNGSSEVGIIQVDTWIMFGQI